MSELVEKTLFQKSAETQALERVLGQLPIGHEITYKEISETVGFDCRSEEHRGKLTSARRTLETQHQIRYGVIRNVGLKRLDNDEIVDAGSSMLGGLKRRAHRIASTLACADFESLSEDKRIKHNVTMAVAGAVKLATQDNNRGIIEQEVRTSNGKMIDLKETLKLFKS